MVAAKGGSDPGGGGGIRKDRVLKTLPEAGYIFERAYQASPPHKEYPDYAQLKEETKAEVKNVLLEIQLSEQMATALTSAVLGARNTLIEQAGIAPAEYDAIKKDYDQVVKSFGQKLDPSSFVLVAYSRGERTYILPSFAEFTPRRQALTLIHEYNMRIGLKGMERDRRYVSHGEKIETVADVLSAALQFDSALHKFLQSSKDDDSAIEFHQRVSRLSNINGFANYTLLENARLKGFAKMFAKLQTALGRPPLASELFLEPSKLNTYYRTTFDPSLVKRFNHLVPNLASELDGKALEPSDFWRVYFGEGNNNFRKSHDDNWIRNSPTIASAELFAMFDNQCFGHSGTVKESKVFGDALLHFDDRTQRVYMIHCLPSHIHPNVMKGYAEPMSLK